MYVINSRSVFCDNDIGVGSNTKSVGMFSYRIPVLKAPFGRFSRVKRTKTIINNKIMAGTTDDHDQNDHSPV